MIARGRTWLGLQRLRWRDRGGYGLRGYDELECIFVHVPKTGGISVAQALFGNLGGGHLPIETYRRIFGPHRFDRYFKFAFVRDPWDRLLSAYRFVRAGGLEPADRAWARAHPAALASFDAFVAWLTPERARELPHLRPQSDWLCMGGALAVDFVGRYERFESDFAEVCGQLGVQARLPHENPSGPPTDHHRHYTDASAQKVADLYREDIERFGY